MSKEYEDVFGRFPILQSPVAPGYAATYETTGAIATANSAGQRCVGVATIDEDGGDVVIQTRGVVLGFSSEAIACGQEVSTANDGSIGVSSAGHYTIGMALKATSGAGEWFPIFLGHNQKNA